MKLHFSRKSLTRALLAITLPVVASATLAAGSHSGGHGHAKPKVDYSDVEEHEFGKASDPGKAVRTIEIFMSDKMRFEPAQVEIERGDTVRFVVRNKGHMQHEMVLGTDETLGAHAKMMMKFPGMEHEEPHMSHVAPGEEHVMGWQFTKAGEFSFACLVPGHFEAGMKGKIVVR